MKREGRQHGMVRTELLLPPPWNSRMKNKMINECNSPLAADFYAKVSSKTRYPSKFTGKCGKPRCMCCHWHPVCKSRGKAKGTHKLKSYDVAVNHRLLGWRVVDNGVGLNYTGVSASDMLRHLYGKHCHEMDEEEEEGGEEGMVQDGQVSFVHGSTILDRCNLEAVEDLGPSGAKIEEDDGDEDIGPSGAKSEEDDEDIGPSGVDTGEDDEDDGDEDIGPSGVDIEEEDDMGFYYVGTVWDFVDDDGDWCVVGQILIPVQDSNEKAPKLSKL
ncbi:hypothetical protein ACLOJK_008208 [Asimina triloba]